ncbi:MAG: Uma2 family endonuclease [Chloroflexota bacterium]
MVSLQRLTLDEFLALPADEPTLELEPDGTVAQKVPPKGKHSWLQFTLCERINRFAGPGRLARAFPELRAVFGEAAYVPDVSIYRWERIPRGSDGEVANDFGLPPDVAVEIVSPDQSTNALLRRCLWYVEHGVYIALLVDPVDRSVVRFSMGAPPLVLRGDDAISMGDLLPDFQLSVTDLFAELRLS